MNENNIHLFIMGLLLPILLVNPVVKLFVGEITWWSIAIQSFLIGMQITLLLVQIFYKK